MTGSHLQVSDTWGDRLLIGVSLGLILDVPVIWAIQEWSPDKFDTDRLIIIFAATTILGALANLIGSAGHAVFWRR